MSETGMVRLRPVTESDHELLYSIYASTRTAELAHVPWSPEEKEQFLRAQFNAQHRWYREHYEGAAFSIIEVDGQPAGRYYVMRWAGEVRVMEIALLPEYRGRGIGERLLRELIAEAAAARTMVSIHVEVNNPARRLYERVGFVPAGEHGIYLRMECKPAAPDA